MTAFANATAGKMRVGLNSRTLGRLLLPIAMATLQIFPVMVHADDAEGKKTPLGQFVTVDGTVDDHVFARVSSAAIKLQGQAVQEKHTRLASWA